MAYEGKERRVNGYGRRIDDGTCVFHKECMRTMAQMEVDIKKRVPIWVLVILVAIVSSGFATMVGISNHAHNVTMDVLKEHILAADIKLEEMHDKTVTIELRQRLVMQKLGIPGYAQPYYVYS